MADEDDDYRRKKIELKAKICSYFVYHSMIILAFDAVTGKA